MRGAAFSGAASTVAEIEQSVDMSALCKGAREFAAPLGYDRFVLYAALPPSEDVIGALLWLKGDWVGDGGDVDPGGTSALITPL